jgi:hypothetical protein
MPRNIRVVLGLPPLTRYPIPTSSPERVASRTVVLRVAEKVDSLVVFINLLEMVPGAVTPTLRKGV